MIYIINITSPSRYKVNRKQIRNFTTEILNSYNISLQEPLNIVFIGRTKMRSIAGKYKNEDVALPILSFKYNEPIHPLFGELVICYPQVVLLAAERNKTVDQVMKQLLDHGIKNLINC